MLNSNTSHMNWVLSLEDQLKYLLKYVYFPIYHTILYFRPLIISRVDAISFFTLKVGERGMIQLIQNL